MIFSNTEFYYCSPSQINNAKLFLDKDEAKHLYQVMRHKIGDVLFVTDGFGNIYESKLIEVSKTTAKFNIQNKFSVENKLQNIIFFIPILKSSDRLEFALEKSVELGITSFVIYSADKSYKRGVKLERWEKVLVSAMKQSLRAYKPKIVYEESLKNENTQRYQNVFFEQLAELKLLDFISQNTILYDPERKINFVFGPEGGNTKSELANLNKPLGLKLTNNRLRTETAIITAASIISTSQLFDI